MNTLYAVLAYIAGGGVAGGTTYLNFRENFAEYCDKYGKKYVMAIAVILAIAYPITLPVAAIMYIGKTKTRQEKLAAEQAAQQTQSATTPEQK